MFCTALLRYQERSRGLLSCDMPICNPFMQRNYRLCREATLQVIPALSPVAVKSLDAINLPESKFALSSIRFKPLPFPELRLRQILDSSLFQGLKYALWYL